MDNTQFPTEHVARDKFMTVESRIAFTSIIISAQVALLNLLYTLNNTL